MTSYQENAIAKLREQQSKQPERSAVWYAASQLIAICAAEPAAAEILCADLDNPDMDIVHAEEAIHKLADKYHAETKIRGRSCVAISDAEAEIALREFYSLPAADAPLPKSAEAVVCAVKDAPAQAVSVNLADFL